MVITDTPGVAFKKMPMKVVDPLPVKTAGNK